MTDIELFKLYLKKHNHVIEDREVREMLYNLFLLLRIETFKEECKNDLH